MHEIEDNYFRPKLKKIDNITTKIGIDIKNIQIVEDFLPQDEVEVILNELKKHEPEYDSHHTHGKGLSYRQIDNKMLKYFASYITPLIAERSTGFYEMNVITDIDLHYAFHPSGSYLDPHTDVIGWVQEFYEENNYETQEKYFPYFWSGHLANILYLNDDYEGGELFFPKINIFIKPQKGDLYLFPSSFIYSHKSMPIKSGTKYSIVTMFDYNDKHHKGQ
jgi:hypothetical protein